MINIKNVILGLLCVGLIIAGIIYINNDSVKYQVKPCNISSYLAYNRPVIIEPIKYTAKTNSAIYEPVCEPKEAVFTDEDIDLMARVVMSESSILPYIGKVAVAYTIINRYESDKFPDDIPSVIDGQYSTADNGEPDYDCYRAVYDAIDKGEMFPPDMFYFRSDEPHPFGYQYFHCDNMFFSTDLDYEELVNGSGEEF